MLIKACILLENKGILEKIEKNRTQAQVSGGWKAGC